MNYLELIKMNEWMNDYYYYLLTLIKMNEWVSEWMNEWMN